MEAAHVLAMEAGTFGPPPHPVELRTTEPQGPEPQATEPQTSGPRATEAGGCGDSPAFSRTAQSNTERDAVSALSDRQRRVLEFERHWWRYAGAKETAIRAEFAISATRYYQILNALIDSPAALVTDPMLVKRLRRLRATRRRARAGGTARLDPAEM